MRLTTATHTQPFPPYFPAEIFRQFIFRERVPQSKALMHESMFGGTPARGPNSLKFSAETLYTENSSFPYIRRRHFCS